MSFILGFSWTLPSRLMLRSSRWDRERWLIKITSDQATWFCHLSKLHLPRWSLQSHEGNYPKSWGWENLFYRPNHSGICIRLPRKIWAARRKKKKDLDNIRTKVRSLGRLVNKMNKDCVALNSKSLSHFLKPGQFRLVVASVKALSQEADSPQLAITLGHYVKQACLLKMCLGVV